MKFRRTYQDSLRVEFIKLNDFAISPRNAYRYDAGWDLFCSESVTIVEGEGKDIKTGIAVSIPDGFYGRIVPRSSTMRKRGLMVMEGIIDAGFRGELFSFAYHPTAFKKPDRRNVTLIERGQSIAQLIIQPVPFVYFAEVKKLQESERGEKGFGSSGK